MPTAQANQHRLDTLHALKLEQARAKRETGGPRDADEQGMVLLPPEAGELVEAMSGSGVMVKDYVLKGFQPESNHPSGGFFGPKAVGENFRRLLDAHPTYLHPDNSMAGVYMVNFNSYRKPGWNPDFDFSHLHEEQQRYRLDTGIGGVQHFCPDLKIGLDLGWGGLLDKVRHYRAVNAHVPEFYDGLEAVIRGVQSWVRRHAVDARSMAACEDDPERRANLEALADICERQATEPPQTFREACQWLTFFQAVAKMYNGSGEWGQLDELLRPYYERDMAAGTLDDEEAIFHLVCLLLSETAYVQLGGPDSEGNDLTSPVSFLILEAVHRLKAPANIGVRVGDGCSRELFRRSVEILFEDRMGFPKFIGDKPCTEGYARNGIPLEVARTRTYAGCHWLAVPGREYCMSDMIKVELATVLDVALAEMMDAASRSAECRMANAESGVARIRQAERPEVSGSAETEAAGSRSPSTATLWDRFKHHLTRAVEVLAAGIDFHLNHMHEVFPELLLDLFCHGPVEKGLDASNGGVEYYTICVDAASLATVADSFAAMEQRIEQEERLGWRDLMHYLETDWGGTDGERARLMMRNLPRFGSGGSRADEWAERIAQTFTRLVTETPAPGDFEFQMVPGLFSWAKVIDFGKRLGATPNGRKAGEPLSHGPNPDPGFNEGAPGTPSQLATAVARVQPGYGNTAPLQLDLDPGMASTEEGLDKVEALIRSHFDMGGTLININVIDKDTILEAQRSPEQFPDLIVRVTGFSAYFASLSEEMRQFMVDRIVAGD